MIRPFIFKIIFVCWCLRPANAQVAHPVNHSQWTVLLKKHVRDGHVDYKGLSNDKSILQGYLDMLSNNAPSEKWPANDQMAYWINAYNAFTVKLILDHYPLKSIKDIGSKPQITFVNTPWQIKFFSIGGRKMNLDEIEHQILRKQFNDPRIHFAIVCASKSCAKLRSEAYEASRLNIQLDEQAKDFLSDETKNEVAAATLTLSNYFKWYKSDFTKQGSLITYLNKYSPVKIDSGARITYKEYDWSLNN